MIVGLLFLIQSVLADAGFCPTPLQGKSGGNLSVVTKDFGPFDAKKCILDQVGEPSNCKCKGIDKVFAESSLIDANDMYRQAIEEATEDAYIKSYQSAIKSIFQGTIAADVYLKDKKLKEEDLIRFNGCRPNALFEVVKTIGEEKGCVGNPSFKRRLSKLVGSRQMNLLEAEEDKKALARKSVNEIIESGKNAFYGQIIAIAQNVPTDPKYCIPYKAYLEFTKGDSPASESWQELTHPTNESNYGMPEDFPFRGATYQLDMFNSEDQIIKDYLSKGKTQGDDLGFMKGMDFDEPQADPKEMLENRIKRDMRRMKALERHPFLSAILKNQKLREEYEKFVGNEDTSLVSENGIIKDADFMKKIMESQNKECGKMLDQKFIKGLLCGELPKPSKDMYRAKILPTLYRDRGIYPAPGLSYALVKKYNDNYCPRKPSRPGTVVKSDEPEENIIETVLSPVTSEMSGLELMDSPYASESGYFKFNEKMCSGMKKCGKAGTCDQGSFWSSELASKLLEKISDDKLAELAKERGVDIETLKKQIAEAVEKSLKSRVDDEEDELLAEVKDLAEEEDEDLVEQLDVFVRYNQRQNMQFPKESVASIIASCKDGDKCNEPNYWGERTGKNIYAKLSEQDRAELARQFNLTPEQLESELIKNMQGKFNSGVIGKVSTSDIVSDLGLQALAALEVKDEKASQDIRDLLAHSQERNSLGLKLADLPVREGTKDAVAVTGLLIPESEKSEGRSIFADYAINGDRKDQTALEELAPVLAERDRNPIGINAPIELPYQRRVTPAPPSTDFPSTPSGPPIAELPNKKPVELPQEDIRKERATREKETAPSQSIERSSVSSIKDISKVGSSSSSDTKGSIEKPSTDVQNSKETTSTRDSALDDAIKRAKQTLEDYKKAQASTGNIGDPNNDPRVKDLANEIERLRREKEQNQKELENLSNSRNTNRSRKIASTDSNNGYGNIGGGIGRQTNNLDPRSLPPTVIDPAPSNVDSEKSGKTGTGVAHSSGGAKTGGKYPSVSPKGSMNTSQAVASLRGKGVLSGDTLLEFDHTNHLSSSKFRTKSTAK